ncbi:hypothetical protein ACFC6L_29050 [Kitasatospora phosalacinea]|uniref:hypothetical protein n=1 Tax=Kitasatospora phosalacinea TaxID=2065 RepID=UPI0035D7F24D
MTTAPRAREHEHWRHRCPACGTCRWCTPCACRLGDEDDYLDADLRAAETHGDHAEHRVGCGRC